MQDEKILITGASGLVGTYLLSVMKMDYIDKIYVTTHEYEPTFGKPIQVDLAQTPNVSQMLEKLKPHIIINLAALANVDQCEIDRELAKSLNKDLVSAISKYVYTSNRNAYFLHVSTSYVFDGAIGNYNEDSQTNPINWYGMTKLQGENEISYKLGENNWCIARVSTTFGIHPRNQSFPLFIIKKLRNCERVKVMTDQYTSPTYAMNLSKMIKEIVDRRIKGIIHISGASRLSRYEQALEVAKLLGLDRAFILKGGMDEMMMKANRPRDSSLNTSKASKILRFKPETFGRGLEQFVKELSLNGVPV
jgi:dTDP-4-dehydrorhamnose reductase